MIEYSLVLFYANVRSCRFPYKITKYLSNIQYSVIKSLEGNAGFPGSISPSPKTSSTRLSPSPPSPS